MKPLERARSTFLRFAGYLIPLVQSLPSLGIWTGLMTVPFASYLAMMLTNLSVSVPAALSEFFTPYLVVEKTLLVVGLVILVYSAVYLRMKRREGIVTSGLYRLVRHPQYFGIILATLGMTSWSVWILRNTFGIGFLNSSQTISVWLVQLVAYIALASVEEIYLGRTHAEAFKNYVNHVPFIVPFVKTKQRVPDILLSILVPSMLLFILISLQS